jgi:hypothetical protein
MKPRRALYGVSLALACAIFLLPSCGYHLGGEESVQRLQNTSLSIPYVQNDIDGQLTDELIKTFAASGIFTYQATNGSLELRVEIIRQDNACIGWKYNRNVNGKRNKDLICTEGRRLIDAEVTFVDTLNDEVLLGPIIVQADLDFDYYEPDSIRDLSFITSSGKRVTSVDFSLGQLDSTEGAYDASFLPLTRLLAKKILDLILHASYY